MSAAHAVKPGPIADYSTSARPTGPRGLNHAHLSLVADVPQRAATARDATGGVAGAPRTRLRLTRRGRVVFTTLAALPIVLGSLAIVVNGGVAAAEDAATVAAAAEGAATVGVTAFEYVTIASGQSLWQLAESIAPSQDPRDVIADIVNLNQLASEAVQPGQRIALPAGY